ncbi:MAG: hypothetical protein QOE63_535 [Acidimicrobiaceae bacterium]
MASYDRGMGGAGDRTPALRLGAATVGAVEPVVWAVDAAAPGSRWTVRAEARVGESVWESSAEFVADAAGAIDPARQAPVAGSYEGVDPAGLLWSMLPRAGDYENMPGRSLAPIDVTFVLARDGVGVARAGCRREILGRDILRRAVDEPGLVGTLFAPHDDRPHPAVIFLGGSEGGLIESFAAALAGEGFTALALAYFGMPGLPAQLSRIPLEYFGSALRWMQRQPEVDAARIAVGGASKGGEAAVLVGATFPDIAAVVGVVPSGVAFMSIGRTPLGLRRSSWSLDGRDVPFVPARLSRPVLRQVVARSPVRLRVFYEEAMKNTAAVDAATIPVERIKGPVLLLSGQDDQMWPSSVLADIAERRLQSHRHPWPHEHVSYPDTGHALGLPFMPACTEIPHAIAGRSLTFGGTRAGTAAAAVAAWATACAFLRESLS